MNAPKSGAVDSQSKSGSAENRSAQIWAVGLPPSLSSEMASILRASNSLSIFIAVALAVLLALATSEAA